MNAARLKDIRRKIRQSFYCINNHLIIGENKWKKIELSLNVVNTLLAYLQDKPFKESSPLIEALVADIKKK